MRAMIISSFLLLVNSCLGGIISGQAHGLEGELVANVTVTVTQGNRILASKFFPDGKYNILIQPNQLPVGDKAINILFQAVGRDDARLDNVFGPTNVSIDVTMPEKFYDRAPSPVSHCTSPPICQKPSRRFCRIRCR